MRIEEPERNIDDRETPRTQETRHLFAFDGSVGDEDDVAVRIVRLGFDGFG